MSNFIHYNDYLPHAEDLANGEEIHINHKECPAGVDTKQRLYIKRTEDGHTILAYCHNCGLHGCHAEDTLRTASLKARLSTASTPSSAGGRSKGTHVIPADSTTKAGDWDSSHRIWVTKYGITQVELDKFKICASGSKNSVILPVYRDSKLLGWQERTFTEGNCAKGTLTKVRPKYLTRRLDKSTPIWWYSNDYAPYQSSDTTIIVEDMLSGIKCSRFLPTYALLGASISDELVAEMIKNMPQDGNFIIFLDDDNRQVRLNQLKIKVRLEQCGFPVRLITGIGKDPKACSNSELEQLLT